MYLYDALHAIIRVFMYAQCSILSWFISGNHRAEKVKWSTQLCWYTKVIKKRKKVEHTGFTVLVLLLTSSSYVFLNFDHELSWKRRLKESRTQEQEQESQEPLSIQTMLRGTAVDSSFWKENAAYYIKHCGSPQW